MHERTGFFPLRFGFFYRTISSFSRTSIGKNLALHVCLRKTLRFFFLAYIFSRFSSISRVSDFCRICPIRYFSLAPRPVYRYLFYTFCSLSLSLSALIFFSSYVYALSALFRIERMWCMPRVSNSTRSGLTVLCLITFIRRCFYTPV